MYSGALLLHSWLRWVVVLLGALAVLRAMTSSARPWSATDDRVVTLFAISLDVQVLIGLLLVWLSPITSAAMHDIGAAMREATLRFWLVEHPAGMLGAVILAHIGKARIRRQAPDRKRRTARLFLSLALLLILASIPWPVLPYGRGLIRW